MLGRRAQRSVFFFQGYDNKMTQYSYSASCWQPRYLKLVERTPELETGGFASPLLSGFAQTSGVS
jgi:hypothetical protein